MQTLAAETAQAVWPVEASRTWTSILPHFLEGVSGQCTGRRLLAHVDSFGLLTIRWMCQRQHNNSTLYNRSMVPAPPLNATLIALQRQVRALADEVCQIENATFRKALYVSMLDGLSACAYPNDTNSGHRFRTFVSSIGNWGDGERISLPQAALYFQADPPMSAAVAGLLNAWAWGQPQSITSDPLPNQLPAHAELEKLKHVNLLWKFRNSILHAFADPSGFDFGNRVEPYYVGNIATHTWRLVVPEQFLRNLLLGSLDALIDFGRQNGLDPQAHLGRELWI